MNDDLVHLPALIAETFGGSRSDARRVIAQGGVKLDGVPLDMESIDIPRRDLSGHVLQLGRRRFKTLD